MEHHELVTLYKEWLRNPSFVDEKTAIVFKEIKEATKAYLKVYEQEKEPYDID